MKQTLRVGAVMALAVSLVSPSSLAGLIVTPVGNTGADGQALVNDILGAGFTVVPGSVQYVAGDGQGGFFTGGASAGITIDQGILLTSGQASLAVGPNTVPDATYSWGTAGDGDLNSLVPGYTTFDASSLTFKFTAAQPGKLYFNYVFGSEEYNEYVHSAFNNVFGFFLDGVNVALLPGSTTPVSINNVNYLDNSAYYINNAGPGDPIPKVGPLDDIQYDGFTVPL